MRRSLMMTTALLLAAGGAAMAQTKPTQPVLPVQPVPSGGVTAVRTADGRQTEPARGILFSPQFAPPGVQVPGGPPASDTPTLISPTVLGNSGSGVSIIGVTR